MAYINPYISDVLDIGTEDDAGFWLAALPFVHFEIREHSCRDLAEPLPFVPGLGGGETGDLGEGVTFHATTNTLGGQ